MAPPLTYFAYRELLARVDCLATSLHIEPVACAAVMNIAPLTGDLLPYESSICSSQRATPRPL